MKGLLKEYIETYGAGVAIQVEKGKGQLFVPLREYLKKNDIPFVRVSLEGKHGLSDYGGRAYFVSNDIVKEHPYITQFMGNNVRKYGKKELHAQEKRKEARENKAPSKQTRKQKAVHKKGTIKADGFVYYTGKNLKWEQETRNELNDKSTKYETIVYNKLLPHFGNTIIRQHPIKVNGRLFFLDMYIKEGRVAIEVDGGYHFTPEQIEADDERTRLLHIAGIQVLRIRNEDVRDSHRLERFATEVRTAVAKSKETRNTENGGI